MSIILKRTKFKEYAEKYCLFEDINIGLICYENCLKDYFSTEAFNRIDNDDFFNPKPSKPKPNRRLAQRSPTFWNTW